MSLPPIPAINVSSLNINELNLAKINVDDVAFHKLDTHGYFMNIYIMLWCVFSFVLIQTIFMGFFTYRYHKARRLSVHSKCGYSDGLTQHMFEH